MNALTVAQQLRNIRKLFCVSCYECKDVRVWFWKQRCDFCDVGEGLVQ